MTCCFEKLIILGLVCITTLSLNVVIYKYKMEGFIPYVLPIWCHESFDIQYNVVWLI